jgi:hypothetical protein
MVYLHLGRLRRNILDGWLHHGVSMTSGELGHMVVSLTGRVARGGDIWRRTPRIGNYRAHAVAVAAPPETTAVLLANQASRSSASLRRTIQTNTRAP